MENNLYTFNLDFAKIFTLCVNKFYAYNTSQIFRILFTHRIGSHNLILIQSLNSNLNLSSFKRYRTILYLPSCFSLCFVSCLPGLFWGQYQIIHQCRELFFMAGYIYGLWWVVIRSRILFSSCLHFISSSLLCFSLLFFSISPSESSSDQSWVHCGEVWGGLDTEQAWWSPSVACSSWGWWICGCRYTGCGGIFCSWWCRTGGCYLPYWRIFEFWKV